MSLGIVGNCTKWGTARQLDLSELTTVTAGGGARMEQRLILIRSKVIRVGAIPILAVVLGELTMTSAPVTSGQNGQLPLFGPRPEQWSVKMVWAFVKALQEIWDTWT